MDPSFPTKSSSSNRKSPSRPGCERDRLFSSRSRSLLLGRLLQIEESLTAPPIRALVDRDYAIKLLLIWDSGGDVLIWYSY